MHIPCPRGFHGLMDDAHSIEWKIELGDGTEIVITNPPLQI
jgi:hypothetical protein